MKSYIDEDYYYDVYEGDLIPQEKIEKFAKGASYEVKMRIHNKDISNFETEIRDVTCSIAEILYNQYLNKEKLKKIINGSEKIITSEKVGDYSRNIQNISSSELINLASDETIQKEINKEIEKQLLFTGLLYGGVNIVR